MKTYNSPSRIILAAFCAFACAVATRAQVTVPIGTIANNETVMITYEVAINDPLPGVGQISSQGAISGSNFTTFNTDDPETAAANDATITLLPNDPPVVDLNGAGAGEDVTVAFTEQTSQLIAPAGTITDVDGDDILSLTATLTARLDGDGVESLSLNGPATAAAAGLTVSYTSGTGVLSISGAAAASVYQTILDGILYDNTSDNPTTTSRSVTVVASDGVPGTSRTSTVTVSEVNDPPVAVDDVLANVPEDSGARAISMAQLLSNDTEPAGESAQTLTIVSVSNPVGGTVSIVGPNVIFNPAADYNGAASFEYVAEDNGTTAGASDPLNDTGAVSFTIAEVNDPPVAVDDPLSDIAEDSAARTMPFAGLLGNDSSGPADESGQTLTITSVLNAVGGSVAIVGTDVVFTPTADFNGAASFDYVVEDNGTTDGAADPRTDTGAVSFTITEVNDSPIAVDDALTDIAEDSSAQTIPFATLVGNDSPGPNEAGQTLTVISVSNPVGGTVAIVGTDVIFTPTADYNGLAAFDYVVQDNGTTAGAADPLTDTGNASFNIVEINDPPIAGDDVLTDIAEDSGPRTIPFADLLANDERGPANESGQNLTITTVSNPVGGTVAIVGTDVIFTPPADYNGPASFDYVIQDDGLSDGSVQPRTDTGSVSFNITPVAEAPGITSASTAEDVQTTSGLVITPSAVDGAEITHFRISATTGGTLFQADGTTPIPDGSFITIAEGAAGVRFTPLANLNSPAGSTFSFVAEGAANSMGAGLGAGTTATITVSEVNDPPVAIDETILPTAEDSTYTIAIADLIANDGTGPGNESSQTLNITAVNTPVGGTVTIVGTDVVFTPTADFNGAASFNYVVEDNGTTDGVADPLTDTGTVSFTITSVNDLPVAGADAIVRRPGQLAKVAVAELLNNDSDAEGGTLTVSLPSATSANGASITREGNWIIYSAAPNDNADSFTYTVTDADGGAAVGTVSVTVEADTSASDNVLAIEVDGADRVIRFVGIPGVVYTVQFTLDLNSGIWTTLGSEPAGANGRFAFRDVNPPPPQRFYRTTYP